ncbi:MAG: alpha/beta hydrolase [Planctomycetaceae bacterium]|nr:alpha/beta hydrolase [Planctomycetaceae bacterium]
MEYQDQGSGVPVLLIHGYPFNSRIWDRAGTLLTSRGWRVIAPDLCGFRKSPLPDGEKITTMECFADDLHCLLHKIGITEKVIIAGLSMGGYVAMQFARKYAEQLSRIVLCGTKTAADPPQVAENRRKQATALLEGALSLADIAETMIPKLFSASTQQRKPELLSELRNIIIESQQIKGVAAATLGMAERPDTTEVLRQLNVPVLVICGAEDQFSPPLEMRRLAETTRQGTYIEISEAGHLVPMEQPELFAEAFHGMRR